MTTTRYNGDISADNICFSESTLKEFKQKIQSNCYFERNEADQELICKISDFPMRMRYYLKGGTIYFHVSNDQRRQIVLYLRKKGEI
jgi:hypothetical protein